MINSENSPKFVESTLKVTATENFDISKELAHENTDNKTIEELLKESDEKQKD